MESGPGVTCAEDGGSHHKPKEHGRAKAEKGKETGSPLRAAVGTSLPTSGLDCIQNDLGLLTSQTQRMQTVTLDH